MEKFWLSSDCIISDVATVCILTAQITLAQMGKIRPPAEFARMEQSLLIIYKPSTLNK